MLKLHPSILQLKKIYHELSLIGARSIGVDGTENGTENLEKKSSDRNLKNKQNAQNKENLFVNAASLSYYDPRLFHVLVDFIYHHWHELNPYKLRQSMKQVHLPQCVLVIFNFVVRALPHSELAFFYDYLARDIKPVAPQLYFLGVHAPGSRSMSRAATECLQEFLDWGFLAREKPVVYLETGERLELGFLSPMARLNLAKNLADRKGCFSLQDYLECIDGAVSRQQAVLDLKNSGYFKLTGKGRGSQWQRVKNTFMKFS